MKYQAPFGMLEIRTEGGFLREVRFLAKEELPADDSASKVAEILTAYFENPDAALDFPLQLEGTDFQKKVWAQIVKIPRGCTKTYGQIAQEIGSSSARAVGQACGSNPIPLFVPCHRVVSKTGVGGFNKNAVGSLDIKRWLLRHES